MPQQSGSSDGDAGGAGRPSRSGKGGDGRKRGTHGTAKGRGTTGRDLGIANADQNIFVRRLLQSINLDEGPDDRSEATKACDKRLIRCWRSMMRCCRNFKTRITSCCKKDEPMAEYESSEGSFLDMSTGSSGQHSFVVWISLNPRDCSVDVYPLKVQQQIEEAKQNSLEIVQLGPDFYNAAVVLTGRPYQKTARGSRPVLRIALDAASKEVKVYCLQTNHGWRFGRKAETGAEERKVALEEGQMLDMKTLLSEPLWEWCRRAQVTVPESVRLPVDDWGIYTAEQNKEIEKAFQSHEPQAEIVVGDRNYQVVFGPELDFARQVDPVAEKKRLVRRLLVTRETFEARMPGGSPMAMSEQDSNAKGGTGSSNSVAKKGAGLMISSSGGTGEMELSNSNEWGGPNKKLESTPLAGSSSLSEAQDSSISQKAAQAAQGARLAAEKAADAMRAPLSRISNYFAKGGNSSQQDAAPAAENK